MSTKFQRIFILGSCVSRDALESAPDEFDLAGYIARTSLASIDMPPVENADVRVAVAGLESPFQRKMLLNDLNKTTLATIKTTPHELLLLDFVDERFNLLLSGETFFSYSGELEKSGLDIDNRNVISPDSESFLTLWVAGLDRLLSSIDQSKVVLNRVYWAEHFPDGSDASSIGWIRRNNATLRRLYDAVDQHWDLKRIDYPEEIVVADPAHRWGVAPYHYTNGLYFHATRSLREFLADA